MAALGLRGVAHVADNVDAQRAQALLWRQLTTIALDAPLHARDYARGQADTAALLGLCDEVRFGPLTRRRLQAASGVQTSATVAG